MKIKTSLELAHIKNNSNQCEKYKSKPKAAFAPSSCERSHVLLSIERLTEVYRVFESYLAQLIVGLSYFHSISIYGDNEKSIWFSGEAMRNCDVCRNLR